MIDIHNHTLFAVDDGAKTIEDAIGMLEAEAAQGVTDVILTPHYRHEMFESPMEKIEAHFKALQEAWEAHEAGTAERVDRAEGVPDDSSALRLHLGCEYHIDSEVVENLKRGRCRTLADSCYVLAEYSHDTEYSYIKRTAEELLANGYEPVIAHAERYACFVRSPELLESIRRMGCMVQLNCDSVLGLDGREVKRFCRKVLKNGWADIIASDAHGIRERACHMQTCLEYVRRKYKPPLAEELFRWNPERILGSGNGQQ